MAYVGRNVVTFNDYDAEPSTVSCYSTAVTAANHDAQVAALTSFIDAIVGITLGLKVRQQYGNVDQILAASSMATDPFAQREAKWLVRYKRPTGTDTLRMEIPCADLQFLDENNRGFLDLDGTEGAAFVSAFEAFVKDDGGNAVEVISVQHIGVNI